MSLKTLTEEEQTTLNSILENLRYLFSVEEVLPEEVDKVLENLKSDEVRAYVKFLAEGSKPEVALRKAFLAGRAILTKYLLGDIVPEINDGSGFIDYHMIRLEKSLELQNDESVVRTDINLVGADLQNAKW